jgi:hypothetical protein
VYVVKAVTVAMDSGAVVVVEERKILLAVKVADLEDILLLHKNDRIIS